MSVDFFEEAIASRGGRLVLPVEAVSGQILALVQNSIERLISAMLSAPSMRHPRPDVRFAYTIGPAIGAKAQVAGDSAIIAILRATDTHSS
ncbi:MAG TPA: hypothetical protein DEV93_01955 [Chloroflexi bacterium]|nr:hypothetical protein [Chloroflexota bacterium]